MAFIARCGESQHPRPCGDIVPCQKSDYSLTVSQGEDIQSKVSSLRFSYHEVIDATKHQDDKIGRFLTAIAFLSASSFAMANLGNSQFLTAVFYFTPNFGIKFSLVTLLVYFLGVLVTILLLLSSFATPLKFPSHESGESDTLLINPYGGSTIFFNEIARETKDAWFIRWQGDPKKVIANEKYSLLVETYNLSLRIRTKYGRMNEAISVFSFAVLGLALSIVCIVIAATKGKIVPLIHDDVRTQNILNNSSLAQATKIVVKIDSSVRWYLGITFVLFILIQLYATHQSEVQASSAKGNIEAADYSFIAYVTIIALSVGSLCIFPKGHLASTLLIVVLLLADIAYMFLAGNTYVVLRDNTYSKSIKSNDQEAQVQGSTKDDESIQTHAPLPRKLYRPEEKAKLYWHMKVFGTQLCFAVFYLQLIFVLWQYPNFGFRYVMAASLTVVVVFKGAIQTPIKNYRDKFQTQIVKEENLQSSVKVKSRFYQGFKDF